MAAAKWLAGDDDVVPVASQFAAVLTRGVAGCRIAVFVVQFVAVELAAVAQEHMTAVLSCGLAAAAPGAVVSEVVQPAVRFLH